LFEKLSKFTHSRIRWTTQCFLLPAYLPYSGPKVKAQHKLVIPKRDNLVVHSILPPTEASTEDINVASPSLTSTTGNSFCYNHQSKAISMMEPQPKSIKLCKCDAVFFQAACDTLAGTTHLQEITRQAVEHWRSSEPRSRKGRKSRRVIIIYDYSIYFWMPHSQTYTYVLP